MGQNIVVVGSSNTDMILKLDHIPQPGETILGGEFITAAGGKGANQAVAAARAGGSVTLVARVGNDMFGKQAVAGLVEKGINVDHVHYDDAPSGVALIFVAKDGENSIGVGSGANLKLTPNDVGKASAQFAVADVVILQLETPLQTVRAAAELGHASGALVILNPAPAQHLPADLLQKISILTPNETEAEILTGIKVVDDASCRRAADALLAQGLETVIITLGSRGAFVATAAAQQLVGGFKVTPVDTTAAGDTFNGALAVAIAEGMSILEAVRFANGAAAISVTRFGAQPSTPSRTEIDAQLSAHAVHDGEQTCVAQQSTAHDSCPRASGGLTVVHD